MESKPKDVTYNWSFQKYINLVEKMPNPRFNEYEHKELDYVLGIPNLTGRTVIDVGAGYGRVLPHLAPKARDVIAVEIDTNMYDELKRRATQYPNVTTIQGDANLLSGLIDGLDLVSPVIISLQNSLGTWQGDVEKTLGEMKAVAEKNQGEVVVSLFRQKALKDLGMQIYTAAQELVGEPDLEKTDFNKGEFWSKTGYFSKWRNDVEIQAIIKQLSGKKIKKIKNANFVIIHTQY